MEYVVGPERSAARQSQQMLRQHVHAAGPRRVAIQFARGDAEHCGLAFQHLEAVGGHQDGAGRLVHAVVGPPNPLQQPGYALWSADLYHLIDAAPVYPQVQRRGRHDRAQVADGHGGFHPAALRDLQRPMMQRDRQGRVVQPPQCLKHQLGLRPGVDEDDRRAGGPDLLHHLWRGFQAHVAGPGQPPLRQCHG